MAAEGANPAQLEGSFTLGKEVYSVTLTENQLKWQPLQNKKNKGECIDIADIISVKEEDANQSGWILSYAMHMKDNILRRTVLTFKEDADPSKLFVGAINEKIRNLTLRPKRILVFVNPISGSSNGRKVMEKQLVPIFKEANIHTDIIVTERAHHTEEVLATYDLTSIDSIVLLGGDGLYHEVVDGLLKRLAHDASLDLNDPNTIMPEAKIPIGIIPCGTGNGIASVLNGNYDIETAILSIMIGKQGDGNVFGVYSDNKLLTIAAMQVGYGLWGDIIYVAENRRNMGIFRYPVTMLEYIVIRSVRNSRCRLQYRPVKSEDKVDQASEGNTDEKQEWSQVEGTFNGIGSLFPFDVYANQSEFSQRLDCSRTLCSKVNGRWQMFSFMSKLITFNINSLNEDILTSFRTKEYKFTLLDDLAEEGTDLHLKQLILNIDGDVYRLNKPQFHVKVHSRKLHLYRNAAEDWFMKKYVDTS